MKSTGGSSRGRRAWYWLLILPLAATMFPKLYASGGPDLFGVPFFYWYQMLWTVLAGVVTGIVYYATR